MGLPYHDVKVGYTMDDLRIALQHTIRPDAIVESSVFPNTRIPEASTLNQPNGTSAMGDYDSPYPAPGPQSHAKEYIAETPRTSQPSQSPVPQSPQPPVFTLTLTASNLAAYLKQAADAHHEYESALDSTDTDWPTWYANYILGRF